MMTTTAPTLRPELTRPLPRRIAALPVDARGYPVPWFVPWLADGTPEFRAMDVVKWARAVRERRCWICGDVLGRWLTFAVGPMCGINRTSAEPPSHLECATWSAINCPFLSRPHMHRREDAVINAELAAESAGFAITRNPGVTLVWTTTQYEVFRAHDGGPGNGGRLIRFGDPTHVEWYAAGRRATRDEVLASIASGIPALEAMCEQEAPADQADARRVLGEMRTALEAMLP